jgi:hypothetical protein
MNSFVGHIGATLYHACLGLTSAFTGNRTFIMGDGIAYKQTIINDTIWDMNEEKSWVHCKRGILCFLMPLSKELCPVNKTSGDPPRLHGASLFLENFNYVYYEPALQNAYIAYNVPTQFRKGPDWTWDLLRSTWNNGEGDQSHLQPFLKYAGHYLPEHTEDILWWWSQLTGYIIRPTKIVEDYIEEYKQQIGWTHPIGCMHVRRGDKVKPGFYQEGEVQSIINYLQGLKELESSIGNYKKIFVASDESVNIKKEILAENFPYFDTEKYIFGDSFLPNGYDVNQHNNLKAALRAFTEFMLLVDCDALVGTGTSFYYRMAIMKQGSLREKVNYKLLDSSFMIGDKINKFAPWLNYAG